MGEGKPKLLYLLHSYFNRAGTEIHTKQLSEELASDFDISIVFPERGRIRLIDNKGTDLQFDGSPPIWPQTPYRIESMNRSLSLILEQVKPDLIHLQHFLNWPLSVIDQLAATKIPLAMTLHDYYAITPYFTFEDVDSPEVCTTSAYSTHFFKADISYYIRERQKVLGQSLSRIKHLIAPSHFLARNYQRIFPNDYHVIEHGIRPFSCVKAPAREGIDLRIGYMGGLIPQKGWDLLLEAFNIFRLTNPGCELHFFGGLNKSNMQWDGVHFHGIYEKEQLPEICSQIDVGFIPSIVPETFCLVLSEFWMSQTPVAVSAIGALNDRVHDGENGKKFPPKNLIEIVRTLQWFTDHDDWKRWTYPEPRLLSAMIQDYRELYQKMLRGA